MASTPSWSSLGKREDRKSLVTGFTRDCLHRDIRNLVLTFYDVVGYWDFNGKEKVERFFDSKHRDVLQGPRFRFHDLVFQCTLCPMGWSHKDCIQFYVEFDKKAMNHRLPSKVKSVTACLVLYCDEIEYEYRVPKTFSSILSAQGWPAYRVDDVRLRDFESLHFGCYVELLRVETVDDGDFVDTTGSLPSDEAVESEGEYLPALPAPAPSNPSYDVFIDESHRISRTSKIEWLIDGDLLSRFKAAKHSEGFYSPNFDGGSWCLSCSPCGIKRKFDGQFCIALKLLKLSHDVQSVKVRHSIRISSDDGRFDMVLKDVKVFDYKRKASRFNLPLDMRWSFEQSQWLRITVDVEVEEVVF